MRQHYAKLVPEKLGFVPRRKVLQKPHQNRKLHIDFLYSGKNRTQKLLKL